MYRLVIRAHIQVHTWMRQARVRSTHQCRRRHMSKEGGLVRQDGFSHFRQSTPRLGIVQRTVRQARPIAPLLHRTVLRALPILRPALLIVQRRLRIVRRHLHIVQHLLLIHRRPLRTPRRLQLTHRRVTRIVQHHRVIAQGRQPLRNRRVFAITTVQSTRQVHSTLRPPLPTIQRLCSVQVPPPTCHSTQTPRIAMRKWPPNKLTLSQSGFVWLCIIKSNGVRGLPS
jgi:hypothetical protein